MGPKFNACFRELNNLRSTRDKRLAFTRLTALRRSVIPCVLSATGPDGETLELDDNLKKLMKDLGTAINDALSDSTGISDAIQNVRDGGYDVYLVLEATIGFNRLPGEGQAGAEADDRATIHNDIELQVNAQDMKFLKSLKIRVDDLENQ